MLSSNEAGVTSSADAASRVVVLGGYGVFGSRIVRNLIRHRELEVVVAGRNAAAAASFAQSLAPGKVPSMAVDVAEPSALTTLIASRPAVIVDTVGPFRCRNYELAQRSAGAGIHYIDIADDRLRVAGISELHGLAQSNNALIVSGASTVPAISTAIVDDLAPDATTVIEIEVGISPGNRAPRGLATVRAILGYCGRVIPPVVGTADEYGWGGLSRHRYPPTVGKRWLSHVDTPERALWRQRYPALETASIRAGLELATLHLPLALLARGVRAGLLPSLDRFAGLFLSVANALLSVGTDAGAMHVRVVTREATGQRQPRMGTLIAGRGDGPQIPAAPAALLVKKLLHLPGYQPLDQRGALPCVALISRAEILTELRDFDIQYCVDS